MKNLFVLLLGLCAMTACQKTEEPTAVSVNETPDTRIAISSIPAHHKAYIRSVFREGLPSSVTDAQVDDVVEGYLEEYVHHLGMGYIMDNFHIHMLYEGIIWPGPNEKYGLMARDYFTDNFTNFYRSKNFRYLGKAFHPIYDAYDKKMSLSCAASTPGSPVLSNLGIWFNGSALDDKQRPIGYSVVGSRTQAIRYIYGKINNLMIPTIDAPRIFNTWMTNLTQNTIRYETCIPYAY